MIRKILYQRAIGSFSPTISVLQNFRFLSSSTQSDNLNLKIRQLQIVPKTCYYNSVNRKYSKSAVEGDESMAIGKGDKILRVKMQTLRLDHVLKTGLGIARNKVEKSFYDDRIRLNDARPKKKSQMCSEGDEIDIVRGINKLNPLFIDVNRVEIAEVIESSSPSSSKGKGKKSSRDDDEEYSDDEGEEGDKMRVVLKRYKNLTIENYSVPWKGPVSGDD